ncbi:MAG: Rpn family recombination-promoting nuclease/putative transposase, partial [Planctomycetota bacterium]|nr:Rpn family recombination-promoting nuclease/putative transposase [Planctomycetota bacterium]
MADAEKSDAPHPHDLLVRNVLADADIAADLLRNYLAAEWASALEWDSLKREPGETVAPNLSKLVGDLRYSARFRG